MADHNVVQAAVLGLQLLLEGVHVEAAEFLVRGVHQRGLVPVDDVAVVGGALLQPACVVLYLLTYILHRLLQTVNA